VWNRFAPALPCDGGLGEGDMLLTLALRMKREWGELGDGGGEISDSASKVSL
jgi:hypothetical protein